MEIEISEVGDKLRRVLEAHSVKPRPRHHAELVFEEIVSNIIRHGCKDAPECGSR